MMEEVEIVPLAILEAREFTEVLIEAGCAEGLVEFPPGGYFYPIETLLEVLGWDKEEYGIWVCYPLDAMEAYGERYNQWRGYSDKLLTLLEMNVHHVFVRNV